MRSFSLFTALSISLAALGVAGLTLEDRPPIVDTSIQRRAIEKRHYGSFVCRDQTYNNWCKTILNQQGTSTATVGCAYENGKDQCYATCVSGYTRSSDGSSPLCTLNCASGLTLSADRTTCVNLQTDVNNCGQLSKSCTVPANGSPTCISGNCGISCNSGFTNKNGVCTANCPSGTTLGSDGKTCVNLSNDVNNCGTVGKVCPSPANGDPTCTNKQCGITCDAGYQASGSTCVSVCKDGTVYNPDNGACIRYTGCSTASDCIAQTGNSASYCYLSSTGNACFTPSSNSGGSPAGASCGYRSNAAGDDNGCATGLACINWVCTSPFSSDVNNCGSAGAMCPAIGNGVATSVCSNSACSFTCSSGYSKSSDGKSCVATSSDVNNCGAIGTKCPATGTGVSGAQCVTSSCQVTCGTGYAQSSDKKSCVATTNDVKNCGGLGTVCPTTGTGVTGAQCVSSSCQVTCGSGYAQSSDKKSCVATSNDVNNCGGLGQKCSTTGTGVSGAQCVNSSCQVTCGTGFAQSSDKKTCVATTNDVNNCGGLGTICPATGNGVSGAQCVSSSCQVTCGTGFAQSSDKKSCVATTNDVNNCGGLGTVCPATGTGVSGAQCVSSSCQVTCGTGYAQSSDKKSCVATTNDVNNCGGVGTVCPATGTGVSGAQCVNSACQVTCGTGYAQSSDKKSCVATTNDVRNCGGLGTVCPSTGTGVTGAQCVSSSCQVTCGSGYAQSSDKKSCVATTNDVNNCGSIGTKCPTTGTGVSGAQCVSSSCQVTCNTGYAQSSDKKSCVATSNDVKNCGSVGNACPDPANGSPTCTAGSCGITCDAGYSPSNGACTTNCKDGSYFSNGSCVRYTCSSTADCQSKIGSTATGCYNGVCYKPSSNTAGLPEGSRCGSAASGDDNSCAANLVCFYNTCYNVFKTDPQNCGSYGNACPATGNGIASSTCSNSACVVTCSSGYTLADDGLSCVATSSDVNNCGGLNKKCPAVGSGVASSVCRNSACVVTCSTGYTLSSDKQSCASTCKDGAQLDSSGACRRASCSSNSDCITKTGVSSAYCTYNVCFVPSTNAAGGIPVGSACAVRSENTPPGDDNTCVAGAVCIDYVCRRAYASDVNNCGQQGYSCAAKAGAGYVANSATCTDGVCNVSCTSLYNSVNGVCVLKASAAPRQKKRAQKPITLCPTGETACPIKGAASFGAFSHSQDKAGAFAHSAGGYECLDTSSAVESCGGCASTGEGFDCTRIKHSSGVGCSSGQCVVLSCNKGYAVSANGSKCLKIHTGTARRHKGSSGLIH